MKVEEDEDTRRKKRLIPQALADLQALQRIFSHSKRSKITFP